MADYVILLSIPGLRRRDLDAMPNLRKLTGQGDCASLVPSFPAVTCPVQANMTTGKLPNEHGVVANGFYWRDRNEVEMWTAWNDCIQAPQLWDILHQKSPSITSATWFPLHSKGSGADYVCTPAPIHNADGSESLWCYTKPKELYEQLLPELDHFPLQHFWGPLANIHSSAWIADSAAIAARCFRPNLFYIYLPQLDYAAQKTGPDSEMAMAALTALDGVLERLADGMHAAYAPHQPLWLVASEYGIVPVNHVSYPNRVLRESGLLTVREEEGAENLDLTASRAWALVDHQFSHVFVDSSDPKLPDRVAGLFRGREGIAEVLVGAERDKYHLAHERSGEVILVSSPESWQAYYWWQDDAKAPAFARTVDIHRKPGYDPVELFVDFQAMGIPLDASLVQGSHGAPAVSEKQQGVLLSSEQGVLKSDRLADVDVAAVVLRQFGA